MHRAAFQILAIATFIVASAGSLAGCQMTPSGRAANPEIVETLHTDASNTLSVKQGVPFALDLPGNAGTGYSWMLHGELPAGLRQRGKPFFRADDPDRMGAPGVTRFLMTGLEPNEYDLAFEMRRAWEVDSKPVRRAIIKVTITAE